MKRFSILMLVVLMLVGLMTNVIMAEEYNDIAAFEDEYLAAPAVAGLLLEAAGVDNRFGKGKDGGNYISLVASYMGPGTDFDGVPKTSVGAYQCKIAAFLNSITPSPNVVCTPNNELVQTLQVYSNGLVSNSAVLEVGAMYRIEASGTYRFVNWGDAGIADAKYSLRIPGASNSGTTDSWISGNDLGGTYTNMLEVKVNNDPVEWGAYNIAHNYSTTYTGDGTALAFMILDSNYGDNSGFITVKIYKVSW